MKYGLLFGTAAILLAATALIHHGWYLLCLWPALSFAMVASGYLFFGPQVFGKSPDGTLRIVNKFLLLPYLLYLNWVWLAVRLLRREAPYNQLTDRLYIGRRLMSFEEVPSVEHVIDLTCEFTEPKVMRSLDYHSFPILDGFIPETNQFEGWLEKSTTLPGRIYIHCAEGHGRTGLFAAALLFKLGGFDSVGCALQFVQSKRPLVRLGKKQLATLNGISAHEPDGG